MSRMTLASRSFPRTTMLLAGLALLALLPSNSSAKELGNVDGLDRVSRRVGFSPRESDRALIQTGSQVEVDDRLGLPTFVWASRRGGPGITFTKGVGREEQAARRHLGDYASLYRLGPDDAQAAVVSSIHNTGQGAVIVAFRQVVGNIDVFRDEIRIVMGQDLALVAVSGY